MARTLSWITLNTYNSSNLLSAENMWKYILYIFFKYLFECFEVDTIIPIFQMRNLMLNLLNNLLCDTKSKWKAWVVTRESNFYSMCQTITWSLQSLFIMYSWMNFIPPLCLWRIYMFRHQSVSDNTINLWAITKGTMKANQISLYYAECACKSLIF